jgi:hypothetical protein
MSGCMLHVWTLRPRCRENCRSWVQHLSRHSCTSLMGVVHVQVHQKAFPLPVETRMGKPHKLVDLRRVRVNAASTVFVMQPPSNTVISKPGNTVVRVATPSERDSLKTATGVNHVVMLAAGSLVARLHCNHHSRTVCCCAAPFAGLRSVSGSGPQGLSKLSLSTLGLLVLRRSQ